MLVQKTGMMGPSQDKEFAGQRIVKLDRALRLAKQRPLRRWRDPSGTKHERKSHCTVAMQTNYRRLLGQINGLQSRAQFQCCYKFTRCASKADCPTIGDVNAFNKLSRQLKSQPVKLQFWPLTGPLRITGLPDASFFQWRWIFTLRH